MQAQVKNSNAAGRRGRLPVRTISYWVCTTFITWEMVAGSTWDLLGIPYVHPVIDHLGYPAYLLSILGAAKLPCAVALFIPRFPRLKEWAYAGAIFNYTGAVASVLFVGDGPKSWMVPFIFAVITLASWALRPPERRLPAAAPTSKLPASAWLIPVAVIAAFLVIALLTLPKGPSPW